MPAITKAELKTHLYPEIVAIITRADDDIITRAITTGEGEVKAYLNRFDLAVMFGGTFTDEFFKSILKDVVCWHLIKLSSPNINLELFRTAYQDALKVLKDVMRGYIEPAWPLRPDDPTTDFDERGHISSSSNPKRNNFF